jgi:hypothetical protein
MLDYIGNTSYILEYSETEAATHMARAIISAARVCLPLGERTRKNKTMQKEADRDRVGTNWPYVGADLIKSILRTEGSK